MFAYLVYLNSVVEYLRHCETINDKNIEILKQVVNDLVNNQEVIAGAVTDIALELSFEEEEEL